MNPSTSSITAALLLCIAAVAFAQNNFRVLRGENQPALNELKVSNTPQLLEFSALSGSKATIELEDETQTAIVQHHVNVVMDCSPLIELGGKLLGPVEWTRLSYFEDNENGALFPRGSEAIIYPSKTGRLRSEGELNRYLNITSTNIIRGAERKDNGLYTCTVCTDTGCRSASLMLFLIGAPPSLDFAADNATDDEPSISFADKKYRIGADFCVERGTNEIIELSCDVLGEDLAEHISIAYPTPSRKWYKDGVLLYSVDKISQSVYRGRNANFFDGANGILSYGVVQPTPLYTSREGQVVLAFEASELAYPEFAPEGTTNQTVVDDVFNALTGKWRCEVENSLGVQSAETVITEC